MKIAAIDLGSNSFHMVIVEVRASGAFQVIEREKDMVRLGSSTLQSGRLPAAAMRRGLDALLEYKRLARTHGVDKILSVATSAIREASNGEEFLEQVGRTTGIWPRAISGDEEGRLIYLAALHSVHLEGKRALVVDIGGGSVELALGAGSHLEDVSSEKLGALRMTEAFVHSDPIAPKDEDRLVRHVETALLRAVRLREAGFDTAIGTSGTVLGLGALALNLETGSAPETLHHVTVKAESIHALRKRLVSADLRARLRMPSMDERRADIIVAGSIVLDTILEFFGAKELTLCEWSLREGILLDYIHGHPRTLARAEAYPDVRRRSVVALGERCDYDENHGRQVATLALALFDQTAPLHGLAAGERALLEYASILHDIGRHISYPGHHKHTYYLIKNGDLRGFDPGEIELLANVARYHRRGHPRRKHEAYGSLPPKKRRVVRILSGFLRVADALDRSHRRAIKAVTVSQRAGGLKILCESQVNCDLELWGAPRRTALLEEELGLPIRIEVKSANPASAPVQRIRAVRGQ